MPVTLRKTRTLLGALAALILVSPATTSADIVLGLPDPAEATEITPREAFNIYANRTESWGGGSGAYWNADGTFRAVNLTEESIGFGTWYVTTSGSVCSKGRWFWRQNFGVASRNMRICTRFRRDENGELWSTTKTLRGPWFPFTDDNFSRGNSISASFTSMIDQLGLTKTKVGE